MTEDGNTFQKSGTISALAALAFCTVLAGVFLFQCLKSRQSLDRIVKTGEVTVLTRNNAHCYYIYRDIPMGFEFDLAKEFSRCLGVELKIRTPPWNNLIDELEAGTGDFIAAGMTATPSRNGKISYSKGYLEVRQQVLLHKTNHRIRSPEDLDGEIVHVRRGTSYETRLRELQAQGIGLEVRLHEDVPTEELIRQVAEGEIDITIADSNIAMMNRRYYPDVRIAFPIQGPQMLRWAVRKQDRRLLGRINAFFDEAKKSGLFASTYRKYYSAVDTFDYLDLKKYHRRLRILLPRYRPFIEDASRDCGFDWRLMASVIYQESHFNPRARSYTGVRGMMQLTQTTAREMGIKDRLDPAQSIQGGVRYLRKLYDRYEEIPGFDRILFALGGYNVGPGHIQDARKIAAEKGLDPNRWSSMEKTLPLLRYPEYYKKSAYGYCRGTEPVRYVRRILTYYDILKREAIETLDSSPSAVSDTIQLSGVTEPQPGR